MQELTEFHLDDEKTIFVETAESALSENEFSIVKTNLTLAKALDVIKPVSQIVFTQLRKLDDEPDEVHVTFGIKLDSTLGAILVMSNTNANYLITLKWNRRGQVKPTSSITSSICNIDYG